MRFILISALSAFFLLSPLFSQAQLTYEIRTLESTDDAWEFELYAASSQPGTFHSRGQVYVTFNPEAFAGAESQITLTPLQLTNEKDPTGQTDKYMARAILNGSNRIVITWFASFLGIPGSATFHTEMPEVAAPLFRISLPRSNNQVNPDFTFDQNLMKGQSFFLEAGDTKEKPYE